MNRRNFFRSVTALAGAASLSPAIFIPKFEPVRWKVLPPDFRDRNFYGKWKWFIYEKTTEGWEHMRESAGDEAGPLPRYVRGPNILAFSVHGFGTPPQMKVRQFENGVLHCDTKDLQIGVPLD